MIDLESIKTERKISALLVDTKLTQIEELSNLITKKRKRMTEIRDKHKVSRTKFYLIPKQDRKTFFKLKTEIFSLECTIEKILELSDRIRGKV